MQSNLTYSLFSALLIMVSTVSSVWSQSANIEKLKDYESQLIKKLAHVRSFKERPEQVKENNAFEELLRKTLEYDEAYEFAFDSLSMFMSTIKSPDDEFRIFNWNLEYGQYEEQKYHCLIMKRNKRKDGFTIIELYDKSKNASYQVEYDALTEKKWYGALYYKIIPIERPGATIYTLLGWDGNNMISNKKILETMQFHRSDRVKFGQAIFRNENDDKKTKRRVIFEYNKQAVMSVKLHQTKKRTMIIFDHLSTSVPNGDEIKSTWVPDLSFDAYILENGKWKYQADVDARTGKKFKTKYNAPKDN